MNPRILIPALLSISLVAVLSSCILDPSDGGGRGDDTIPPVEKPVRKNTGKDSDFIGLSQRAGEALARERKLDSRVVEINGKALPVTMDYSLQRINFSLSGGKIIKTSRG